MTRDRNHCLMGARKARKAHVAQRMAGATLIELMVAMTLGLILTALLAAVFVGSFTSSRTQDASSQVDSNGRFALESVARIVRLAGYRNWGGPQSTPPGYSGVGNSVIDGDDGNDADLGFGDVVRVRLHGSGSAPGVADGAVTDCLGAPVAEAATAADRSVNTFSVARSGDTLQLLCDNGTGPVAIASGIDSFQVLYGLDLAGDDRVPELWTSARSVGTRWDQVVALRISMLVSGPASARGSALDSTQHDLFGPEYRDPSDRGSLVDAERQTPEFRNRLRRVFSTTVFVRNRTFASEV